MKRLLRLLAPLAVLLLAAALARESAIAQTPPVSAPVVAPLPFFEIATLEHDPSGRLVASLALPPETKLELSRLTALVDGQRRMVAEVVQREPKPISVVIALDVSGSMQGAPLASARQAALDLIDRLNPGDRVAVVSFADEPQVLSAFTTSRAATIATIESVVAAGTTALYGAVDAAARLIADADTDDSVLVLLSDGVDSGLTAVDRAQSIEAIEASGAAVYSFALQLQGEVDAAYLGEIANRTGGEFSQVAGEQALGALFASLGRKLGADVAVTIEVAPMPIGSHLLTLRFLTGVVTVQSDFVFEVENAGLLVAAVDRQAESEVSATGGAAGSVDATSTPEASAAALPPGAGIVIRLSSLVDLDAFDVVVTLGEQQPATLFPGTNRLLVDSWAFAPGPLPVALQAFLPGTDRLVAETSLMVDVPELEPQLTLRRSDQGGSRVLLATARVQAVTAPILRIFINGEEIVNSDLLAELRAAAAGGMEEAAAAFAEETGIELDIPPSMLGAAPSPGSLVGAFAPVPQEGEIEVRLQTPDGDVLASERLTITQERLIPVLDEQATGGSAISGLLSLVGLLLVAAVGGGIVWSARRAA